MSMDVLTLLKYRGPLQVPSLESLPTGITFPALCSVDGVMYENRFVDNSWHWVPIGERSSSYIRAVIDSHLNNLNAAEVDGLRVLLGFELLQAEIDGLRTLLGFDLTQTEIDNLRTLLGFNLTENEVNGLRTLLGYGINQTDINKLKNIDALIAQAIQDALNSNVPATPTGGVPNAVTLSTAPLVLDWNDVDRAVSYDVFVNGVEVASGITANQYTFPTPLENGTYTWYVVARNDFGSTTGPTWSFVVDVQQVIPLPSQPTGGAPNGITLTSSPTLLDWTASDNATAYDVYLNNVLYASDVATSSVAITSTLVNGTYSWYVVAKNSEGTVTGPVWGFTVDVPVTLNPPVTTGMTGTPDDVTLTTTPTTFTWTPAQGATTYDVYVNSTKVANDLTGTSYTVTTTLNDGMVNEWYVVAKNSDGATQGPLFTFVLNLSDTIYNAGELGTAPVVGPGEVLETDLIDAGLNPGIVVEPPTNDTIYNAGEFGVTPVVGPGEVLETDLIDAGLNPGIVNELYPGLTVYDAGTVSGNVTVPEGAEIELDSIDLNPAP